MAVTRVPYGRIAPTALAVAYRRSFSDIPYAAAVLNELERLRKASREPDLPAELKTTGIAPQLEARYKIVDRFIVESGASQILEIASGFSPRGLAMSEKGIDYVELDMPAVIAQKRKVLSGIKEKLPVTLSLQSGDATVLDDLEAAVARFDRSRPIAVVNEGLLRYLGFDEKARVARNVHSILEQFGGVWITPDVTLQKVLEREDALSHQKHTEALKEVTGVDIDKNRFDSVEAAKRFFEGLGFSIEVHSFMEVVDQLVSPKRLGISPVEVEKTIKDAVVFVMRLV